MTSMDPVKLLYDLCQRWEEETRTDMLSSHTYYAMLQRIESFSSLRYCDYAPFKDENDNFLLRFARWITQVDDDEQKRTLLKFVDWIMYLDEREMQSLYRDVYRRIIVPWTAPSKQSIEAQLDANYEISTRQRLRSYHFYSITESFQHKAFQNINALSGLLKPTVLGERLGAIPSLVKRSKNAEGIIILEDMVGTGNQAARVLAAVVQEMGKQQRVLFAPLIILEGAVRSDSPLSKLPGIDIRPALVVPSNHCLNEKPNEDEPEIFKEMRSIVEDTGERVLERWNEMDEPPENAFGFSGSGALIVTHQNTPNNTLPLIHHKAPNWEPLFRRLHHSYGAPK